MEGGELKEGGPVSAAPLHWIPNQSPGGSVPLLPLKAVYDSSQAQAGEKPAILGVGVGERAPQAAPQGDAPLARKAHQGQVLTPPRERQRESAPWLGFQLPETAFLCLEVCSWLPKWQS